MSAVSLEGILRASHGLTHKFTGFFLTVEKDAVDAKTIPLKYEDDSVVGKFHIVMSAVSKFSDKCRNLVTHTSSFAKSDVPVRSDEAFNVSFTMKVNFAGDVDGASTRQWLCNVQINCDRAQGRLVSG